MLSKSPHIAIYKALVRVGVKVRFDTQNKGMTPPLVVRQMVVIKGI
jgi:hypothetical protein